VIPAVLFDLDGTLVDSAPGILASFRSVLDQHGVAPRIPLDTSLIGPPLRETMERLAGADDSALIDRLTASFREHYDRVGVATTEPYPGYANVLVAVQALGFALLIVTNKRIKPTLQILARHGGTAAYYGVYSQDAFVPALTSKRAVIAKTIALHDLDPARSVYVGDSADDAAAAAGNGLAFIAALYGYGSPVGADPAPAGRIAALSDLPAQLARLAL
jgi:phosphoglycolate phosphatase